MPPIGNMKQIGIFRFDKKDTLALVGAIVGIIAVFKYTLILAIITIILGLISKFTKSKYGGYVIFLGIIVVLYYLINTFLVK